MRATYYLHDGTALVHEGNRVWVDNGANGARRDLSWAPGWWLIDLLRERKLGGCDDADAHRIAQLLSSRRFAPYGRIEAPVQWQDTGWAIERALGNQTAATAALVDRPGLGCLVKDAKGRRRERVTIEAAPGNVKGAPRSTLVLHDNDARLNAQVFLCVATLLRDGGEFEGPAKPDATVRVTNHLAEQRQGCLHNNGRDAGLLIEHMGLAHEDIVAMGGTWLLEVRICREIFNDGADAFVLDF